MAGIKLTKSEHLFQEICESHRIIWNRLPELQNRKQPDYELTLQDQRVVVEVKQIEPNEDDRHFNKTLEQEGIATQTRNPDVVARRIRNQIDKSRPQIKSYLEQYPLTPAVLVLFDNAKNSYIDPYAIQTALHGYEQVVFQVGPTASEPVVVDCGFAQRNNKALRQDKNRHLSALATLDEHWELKTPHRRSLALAVYHNPFADIPLKPSLWYADHIQHFVIDEKRAGQYQNWRRINPTN